MLVWVCVLAKRSGSAASHSLIVFNEQGVSDKPSLRVLGKLKEQFAAAGSGDGGSDEAKGSEGADDATASAGGVDASVAAAREAVLARFDELQEQGAWLHVPTPAPTCCGSHVVDRLPAVPGTGAQAKATSKKPARASRSKGKRRLQTSGASFVEDASYVLHLH